MGKVTASFEEITISDKKYASDDEITSALHAAGKFNPADELNCGACGYDSCRDFAHAMVAVSYTHLDVYKRQDYRHA